MRCASAEVFDDLVGVAPSLVHQLQDCPRCQLVDCRTDVWQSANLVDGSRDRAVNVIWKPTGAVLRYLLNVGRNGLAHHSSAFASFTIRRPFVIFPNALSRT